MRYASIDLETTGLNPDKCQILEFGCVVDNTDPTKWAQNINAAPTFRALILHEEIHGDPFALALNAKLIAEIRDAKNETRVDMDGKNCHALVTPASLASIFCEWLEGLGFETTSNLPASKLKSGLICAGKNFASFDKQFLLRVEDWEWQIPMKHRSIDPGMFYMHPADNEPPKTEICYERANLPQAVAHTAVEDARMVCLLIRHAMKNYGA